MTGALLIADSCNHRVRHRVRRLDPRQLVVVVTPWRFREANLYATRHLYYRCGGSIPRAAA
jgi:hypothetical protein